MDQLVEVKPKKYPTNLLDKDWSQRTIYSEARFEQFHSQVHELEVTEDDVWLVAVPQSGTTWMQELLWLVMNDFEFDKANSEHLDVRSTNLEFDYWIHDDLNGAVKPAENIETPRLIRTHQCLPLLPAQIWNKKTKVVYMARNTKDVLVSEFHHQRALGLIGDDQTVDQYVIDQMQKKRQYDPFSHISEFYALRAERMKMDLPGVIIDVCRFLNKSIDNDTLERLIKHLSFRQMKNNPNTKHNWDNEQVRRKLQACGGKPKDDISLYRKGQMNAYQEELSPEVVVKLDKWIDENFARHNVTLEDLLLLKEM